MGTETKEATEGKPALFQGLPRSRNPRFGQRRVSYRSTANRAQAPGTPLRVCSPLGSKT